MRWSSSTFWKASRRALDLHLVHADQLRPVARRFVDRLEHRRSAERVLVAVLQALEGPEGRLVIGLALEDLAIELDGARDVVQVLLVELGDPVLEADRLRGVRRHLAFASQHGEELGPVLGRFVEDVKTREGLEIVGVELEDLRVRVDRLRHVVELVLVGRPYLVVDALLLVGVGHEVGLLRVDGEQIHPAREAEVPANQRVDRADVVAVEVQHLVVDGDGRFGGVEDVFLDRCRLEERLLLLTRLLENLGFPLEDDGELRDSARSF